MGQWRPREVNVGMSSNEGAVTGEVTMGRVTASKIAFG